jgi:hypothetical protein
VIFYKNHSVIILEMRRESQNTWGGCHGKSSRREKAGRRQPGSAVHGGGNSFIEIAWCMYGMVIETKCQN